MTGRKGVPVGIHVHRSPRTDALVAALADQLAGAATDPFEPSVVSVPTRGVERFLAQQLGQRLGVSSADLRDGVCANVRFPAPDALLTDVVGRAVGLDPDADPWQPRRLQWRLLDLVQADEHPEWTGVLTPYLAGADGTGRPGRHLHLCRSLAGLLHRYGLERPRMLRDWAAGDDTDGFGGTVPADLAWQPAMWRTLVADITEPAPAERLPAACGLLRERPELAELPAVVSFFGPTRIPAAHRELLAALGEGREIHVWLPDPATTRGPAGPTAATPPRRRESPVTSGTRNRLLRATARDSGELALVLDAVADQVTQHDAGPTPPTLLGVLQQALRADEARPPDPPVAADGSLQVHDCHGRPRQVEVLREVILAALRTDPSLQPRDIVVMCPDLDSFAPLFGAAFADAKDAAGAPLPVRIADRTTEQDNDVLQALDRLLDLAQGRFTASEVLDFAGLPAVRARFGFSDEDLERLAALTERANVRWGLDERDRQRYGLPAGVRQNSWANGMERLLTGAAVRDDLAVLHGVQPTGDVSGTELPAVAALAELIDRLRVAAPLLRDRHRVADWTGLLCRVLPALTDSTPGNPWQAPTALAALTAWGADGHHSTASLDPRDVRLWLSDLLAGRPTRTNFRTGAITVCSLAPMRAVPYRMVCLTGLDDQVFPRRAVPDGSDLLARDPRVGEFDAAAQDRQLFVDAIMAATDRLVVTYAGRDLRTNTRVPPSAPVAELIDSVAALTGSDAGTLVVRHPLQPFDPVNFTPGALTPGDSFSHDRVSASGARARCRPALPSAPLLTAPLPAEPITEISVSDLKDFLAHPPKYFLRERLGLVLPRPEAAAVEALPVDLDGLERWQVGDRVLTGLLRHHDSTDLAAAEWARGDVPPPPLGAQVLRSVAGKARAVAAATVAHHREPPREVTVSVPLPGGVRLTGVVPGVCGTRLVTPTYSSLKAKTRLALWVDQLALAVSRPDIAWTAVAVTGNAQWQVDPVPADDAADALARLAAILRTGLTRPLPLMPDAGLAYASTRRRDGDISSALADARAKWTPRYGDNAVPTEGQDPVVALVWGSVDPFAAFAAERAPEGGTGAESTWFGNLAATVWPPVLRYGRRVAL